MKWIVLLALTTLAAAPAAAEVVSNVRTPFTQVFPNTCTGEDLNLDGVSHDVFRVTVEPSGGFQISIHTNINASGTGVTTGAKYTANQEINQHINLVGAGNANVTYTLRIMGQGKVPNFQVLATEHITVNANGNVTVDRLDIRTTCK